uniref:Uncharacterized protein n=1 Tax=Arundo donax TaxID=35708 RepID=A0A0A9ARV3_ARUDO
MFAGVGSSQFIAYQS